jgi:small subunit ribosomal protein S17
MSGTEPTDETESTGETQSTETQSTETESTATQSTETGGTGPAAPGLEHAIEAFKTALAADAERSTTAPPEGEPAGGAVAQPEALNAYDETPSTPAQSTPAPAPSAPAKPPAARRPAEGAAASGAKAASVASGAKPPAAAPAIPGPRQTRRKVREGIVASNAMDKTAVVVIIERVRHPRYAKTMQRTKRLYAHDEANDVRVGDRVRLTETRPLSKLKRWRVVQVLERAR